jgi:hypothetical protein
MKTPEEIGREAAERTTAELRRSASLVQADATLEACFHTLLRLLIAKGILGAQEALDAFVRLSDEIQSRPGSQADVQTLERLCSMLSGLPGAKRPSA